MLVFCDESKIPKASRAALELKVIVSCVFRGETIKTSDGVTEATRESERPYLTSHF